MNRVTHTPATGLSTDDWWIGLDGWVLQDGNYTDFAVGQVRQFALEFWYRHTRRLAPTNVREPSCHAVDDDATYDIVSELVRSKTKECFILDFGLLAYKEWMVLDNLKPPKAGTRLAGEIHLSVDHFAYMDYLAKLPRMPPMIYTWTVEEIRLDTSPTIQVEYGHPLYGVGPDEGPALVRDPERRSWRSIDRTQMWDDEGSYTLRCRLQDAAPTNTMAAYGSESPYGPIG